MCHCVYVYACIVNPDIQTIHRYSHTSIHAYIHTYIHLLLLPRKNPKTEKDEICRDGIHPCVCVCVCVIFAQLTENQNCVCVCVCARARARVCACVSLAVNQKDKVVAVFSS